MAETATPPMTVFDDPDGSGSTLDTMVKPAAPDGFVVIQAESGAYGTCPIAALDYWRGRGYTAADEADVARELEAAAPPNAFDPSGEGVTAKAVHDYLVGLDTSTPEGKAEHDRVTAAERAGENRSTAYPKPA